MDAAAAAAPVMCVIDTLLEQGSATALPPAHR